MEVTATTDGTESLREWLQGHWQRRRAELGSDEAFEWHMRMLFRASRYVKFRHWQRADLEAALAAVRDQPVPRPVLSKPCEERSLTRAVNVSAAVAPTPQPDPLPQAAKVISAAKDPPKIKYCTEPGCRRRLPGYRTRAGLCPHHQQIHRRATWRSLKRRQRKSA